MDAHLSASLAQDREKARTALATGAVVLAGVDRITAAIALASHDTYSPLRTLFEHSVIEVERVQSILRAQDQEAVPPHTYP